MVRASCLGWPAEAPGLQKMRDYPDCLSSPPRIPTQNLFFYNNNVKVNIFVKNMFSKNMVILYSLNLTTCLIAILYDNILL